MSCDQFEWTCARCGKTYTNPFFTSYPREFWKDNKKRVGEVCERCRDEVDSKHREERTFRFGDWVIYDQGYKKETGRVVEDRGRYVCVCYHKGCTTANTNKHHLRHATAAEIQAAPDGIGLHRFDSWCPIAEDCPLIGKCQAWSNISIG